MKYYADYMNDCFFEVANDGTTIVKEWDFETQSVKTFKGGKVTKHPWLVEENGVGDYVEEMTKEEFDTIGEKWVWLSSPIDWDYSATYQTRPMYKHYIKWL